MWGKARIGSGRLSQKISKKGQLDFQFNFRDFQMNLTPEQKKELFQVSGKLGVKPESLYILINFESRWRPYAKNPLSGAMGLIQFTNKTSRGMGYRSAYDLVSKYPTIEQQLKYPVYEYLRKFKPFPNERSLFLAVFYPVGRNKPDWYILPKIYRDLNPGIITIGDYIRKVKGTNLTSMKPYLILGIGILYLLFRKGGIHGSKKKSKGLKRST